MTTLADLVRERTDLGGPEIEHLHRLLETWQLIADLSFADLLLWCRLVREEGFICAAQMRPYTAQTLHPEDAFGNVVRPEELPIIDRAFLEARTWQRAEPLLIDGVMVSMEAIPVSHGGRVIAVMTKEAAPLAHRRPGLLEENYLECADALSRMVQEGTFPFSGEELDPELSPRVGDGLIRLDPECRVIYASPNALSAFRRLGVVSNVIGERIADLGVEASPAIRALSLGVGAEGEAEIGGTVVLERAIPFIVGKQRTVTGGLMLVRDVTELRHRERMLQRKEAMIREVHHRVKNNLQTIASLLRIQARRLRRPDARRELEEAVQRIRSIAVVHETLTRDSSESIEFGQVARELVQMVGAGLTDRKSHVSISYEGDPGRLPSDLATPLAVVLVELLQNAVEHAFDGKSGTVQVRMSRDGGRLRMVVQDDGRGLPDGFQIGLGLQIVRAFVEGELEGTMEIASNKGTTVTLEVPARGGAFKS